MIINKNRFNYIIWYYDGTLYNSNWLICKSVFFALQNQNINTDINTIAKMCKKSVEHTFEYYTKIYNLNLNKLYNDRVVYESQNLLSVAPFCNTDFCLKTAKCNNCTNFIITHRDISSTEYLLKKII